VNSYSQSKFLLHSGRPGDPISGTFCYPMSAHDEIRGVNISCNYSGVEVKEAKSFLDLTPVPDNRNTTLGRQQEG
jgi:hypothetical protein